MLRLASSTETLNRECLVEELVSGRLYGLRVYSFSCYSGDRLIPRGGLFPIDERAKDVHDLYHTLFRMVLTKNYCAPVNLDGSEVLDIYTRTGIWAIQIGEDVESCHVIGNNDCPMQCAVVPPNVNMEVCDINDSQDWNWRHKFRLIFARHLGGVVGDLRFFVNQCYR